MNEHDKVVIFDTTLRDGEQCPGGTLNRREKLEVATALAQLGVDVIEAGFPIASPDDFAAVHDIARTILGPTVIAALARTRPEDIKAAGDALAPSMRRRIHTFSSASDIHLKHILKISREENVRRSVEAVKYALTFTPDVEYSAQDTTRADRDYLVELYTAVAEAGATTLNVPDTVGYAIPAEYGEMINYLAQWVKERVPGVVISVHCHNDLGLAVANSLAAVQSGARQIECAINGLGERAGNCSLEEVVMAIRTRADFLKVFTDVNTRDIHRVSKLVSRLTGMQVQRNKAIVGANAFAHESGIHQDGVLKERTTYEIMRPEDVGIDGSELVLGKHSGRHGLQSRLEKLGVHLTGDELDRVYKLFVELADKKKVVYDDDILALVRGEMDRVIGAYEQTYLSASAGTGVIPTATLVIKKDGREMRDSSTGDGPVDAALKTIDRITGVAGKLLEYSLQSVTVGGDAMGEVSIRVKFEDKEFSAKAASTDIVEASAKAYLACVNRWLASRNGAKAS